MATFSIVINAGGKSSRMGRDKSFLELGGKMMIEHILDQTVGLGDQMIIAHTPEQYAFLGVPVVSDVLPGTGALGGLYTALHAATQPYALVLACDMPFINQPLLEYMMSLAVGFEAVVPRLMPSPDTPALKTSTQGEGARVSAEAEPFRAIYSKACLGPIRHALDAGERRVISFFPKIRLRWLEEGEIRAFDPDRLSFVNCNTPEEFAEAKRIWQKYHSRC